MAHAFVLASFTRQVKLQLKDRCKSFLVAYGSLATRNDKRARVDLGKGVTGETGRRLLGITAD